MCRLRGAAALGMARAFSSLTRRVRALLSLRPDGSTRAAAAARAAEAELWHAFNLSLAVQRDLGAHFHDLAESRLDASRALRAFVRAEAARAVSPAEVRLAASRALRLLQDKPFCFSAATADPSGWAREFTSAYPDLPPALDALARTVDRSLVGAGAPARPLAGAFASVRDRLAKAQEAAWEVRRADGPVSRLADMRVR